MLDKSKLLLLQDIKNDISNDISYKAVPPYINVYEDYDNNIKDIFIYLHQKLDELFSFMNAKFGSNGHYNADASRKLKNIIDVFYDLQYKLKNTQLAFNIDDNYLKQIKYCNDFLVMSGGSAIPEDYNIFNIEKYKAIFLIDNTITIKKEQNMNCSLKLIGQGSYAEVFKYFDDYYKEHFVIKRALKNLNDKEILRFKREFEELKKLNCPYIVKVYSYNEDKNEYIMEYMDLTLEKYISNNNNRLTLTERKNISNQVLQGLKYIHSKNLLHRDICPNNVLLKLYDNINIVKVADFGLVKIPNSTLTSINTEFKGYFNDPQLRIIGFNNYSILHETYAITLLVYFIFTGRTNTDKIENTKLKNFVNKGTNADTKQRFQNIEELIKYFREL